LALLDLGGQSYVGNRLAIHAAQGNWSEFRRDLSEALSLFLMLGCGVSVLVIGLLLFAVRVPVPILGRPLQVWEAWVIGLQAPTYVLLIIPGGIYATAYRAVGMFTRGTMIGNGFRLGGIAVSTGFLLLSASPAMYALAMSGVGATLTGFISWDIRRVIPQSRGIRIGPASARKGWSRLGAGSWHFWIISVAQAINQQGIVLIIAGTLTPEAVAIYATHRTLANIPAFVGSLVQGPMLPELSGFWARNELEQLRRWALSAIRIVVVASGIAALALWVAGPVVYPLWTGRHLSLQPALLAVLISQAILSAGWTTSVWSLLAANHHRAVAAWSFANALVALTLAAILSRRFGVAGAALGSLAGDIACGALVFPVLLSRFLSLRIAQIYGEIAEALIALVPGAMIVVLVRILFHGWWSIAAFVVLTAVLASPTLHLALGESGANYLIGRTPLHWMKSVRSRGSSR
jgi:O-antigen/teichoic acid export membrane protein